MRIVWSNKAKLAWLETLNYIHAEYGYRSALAFRNETSQVSAQLKKFPQSAPVELLLESARYEFRSVVLGAHNKLIYHVSGNAIYVVDLWDTRREPKKQAAETSL